MTKRKPDQVDYYVAYEAKVNAGFDFKKVAIALDEDQKRITLTIPKIEKAAVTVDIRTLDYIFQNNKSETNTVSAQAYKACIADATKESEKEPAIKALAEQNAKNIMKALINPFLENFDSDYELEIISGGVS